MKMDKTPSLILVVCLLTFAAVIPSHVAPALAQPQTDVFTDLASFFLATGPLTEIDFENLSDSASSDPHDLAADEFIPNPLTLHGVTFTDPDDLRTGFCSSSTCQPDPDNPSGGNVTLSLNQGATVALPVGTGGALLVIEGMGAIPFTLQVTDFAGSSIRVDGQAALDDVAYLGFTSASGIQQIEVVSVGPVGGPLILSAAFVELSDPDVTIGVWADPAGDIGPSNGDIVFGSATVQGEVVDLRVRFLDPPFLHCETQDITWCLNVDQNASTGAACGYTGADAEFTLSGELGSLFGGPFAFDGALAGLDPCAVGWYDWDTHTLRLVVPLSSLSNAGTLDYAVEGVFRQKDATNIIQEYSDTAPNSVAFGVAGGFFSSIEQAFAPFSGMPLCSPYKEASVPIQASGTVRLLPELGIFQRAPVANMVQSTYFKTTSDNREFRRGFVELTIPELPDEVEISHAALILPETRGWTMSPKPPVTHEVSYYYSADLVVDTDDYDRATSPISQTFETDENLPADTFSIDVTDAFNSDHEGDTIGFRIKLAVDPTYSAMASFGTSFDPSTDIPPRVLVRISEARADVDPMEGGMLNYTGTQGAEVEVVVPAGAVSETTRLAYENGATTALATSALRREMDVSARSGSLVQVGSGFTLYAYQSGRPRSGSILQEPITVTLHYTDSDVVEINEDTLILNYWNGSEWEYAACGPYDRGPDGNWLAVPICHLSSEFALFGLPDVSSGDIFGPACGAASPDGNVNAVEWSSASTQTFQMYSAGGADPFTATLYVMNGGHYLYLGITINDDEFSTYGTFLPEGDGFRIDFDNDHSGSLFALRDDVLGISAGPPQFQDNFIDGDPVSSSSDADVNGGGTFDGIGAAGRVGNLNHFELRHPLCSGDALDFCLHPGDVVGFRLEYLDAEADGSFGGSQLYPGSGATSEADIVIGTCSIPDWFIYLPLIQKTAT